MFFLSLLLLLCHPPPDDKPAKKQPPPWTLKEGATYTGSYKSVEVDDKGKYKKPQNYTFTLQFETIKGDRFIGKWTWSERVITQVEGRFAKDGSIYMKFTKNLKGNSPSAFDGEASGKVGEKGISMKYLLPSGNRIGLIEGEVKKGDEVETKPEGKNEKEKSKEGDKE